ncbi:MAG: exosortase [Candidatus Jettenia sp. CY-1]|nr:MAG: exosortase [Candidatus Jettenia sp. CY-1]
MVHYLVWILTASLYATIIYVLYRSKWMASDYTHAYFILPIFFWLVWRKHTSLREHLKKIKPDNNFLGLFIFLMGILMYIFGKRQNYLFITTLSLLPVLSGLIHYLYGLSITRILSFPIFYLILIVPLPLAIVDSITLPMRYGITIATEVILRLFDYPITREGLLLSIGSNELFMGQPCSGFRSLITMFSLALVYVYLSKTSLPKKTLLVSLIIPLSLFGNLIRVIALCIITYYFGEAAGQGFFHNFSGIVIFMIILSGLIGLECLFKKNLYLTN